MQTHGYERSPAWKQALALLDEVGALTAAFDEDPFGMAGKLRAAAGETPALAALTFEKLDYDNAKRQADAADQHLFRLRLHAQAAQHLGLLSAKQLGTLLKQLDRLSDTITALPDELFEDDGVAEAA